VFLASMLRDAAARLRIWYSRSSAIAAVDTTPQPTPVPAARPEPTRLTDRIAAGREAVGNVEVAVPRTRRRPIQRRPTLWIVKSRNARQRLYCGPVAVAALIGADVDDVIGVIQRHRNNRRQVRGTNPGDLQHAFHHFGHDMQFVANLNANSPTLATWERNRSDWDFDQAWLLIVTGHWIAVRGRWFVDTFTRGVPVRIADAPRRRKRVRYAYRIAIAST
jgi:hypothetical protein